MPIASIPGLGAYANLRASHESMWPDGRRDRTRLSGVAKVGFRPSFALVPGEAIFTVGSCFARNIEQRLAELGYEVPTLKVKLPAAERASDTENDLLNKYAPHSILNEFRWALQPDAQFPKTGYVKVDDGVVHDLHMAPNVSSASPERVRERRKAVMALYKEIPRCRVIIMTLGLVEAWFDKSSGLYLNAAPPLKVVQRRPNRFRLDLLSVDDVVRVLERIHKLLTEYGHPDFRLLLTVSPVPFRSTFSGRDAIAANTYSKSALRAAAEMFVLKHDNVDYFPSYEIVTHTLRTSAFIQDNRHVTPDVVAAIVNRVEEAYASPDTPPEERQKRSARQLRVAIRQASRSGQYDAAVRMYAELDETNQIEKAGYDEFRFRYDYGKALAKIDSRADAQAQLARAATLRPDDASTVFNLGLLLARLQRPLEAEDMLRRAVRLEPNAPSRRLRLAMQLIENRRIDQAMEELEALLAASPGHEAAGRALQALQRSRATAAVPAGSGATASDGSGAVGEAAEILRQAVLAGDAAAERAEAVSGEGAGPPEDA